MDAQTFGSFIAALRKEKGMTQAELAKELSVTDKAVSRWERGLGFPDIHSLEPLARALDVSVVELMQSRKSEDGNISRQEASEAMVRTVDMVKREQRKKILRKLLITAGVILAVVALYFVLTGLSVRTDVFLVEYSVLPSGGVMTVRAGVAGSMGYIRSCRDVSQDPGKVELQFYSAFGGLNSALGAKSLYMIPLAPECTELYIRRGSDTVLTLIKNTETGQWERVS